MEKEKVLITGGAGYLGGVITRYLLERGCKVTCLDTLMYRQQSPLCFAENPDYEFIRGDARDQRLLGNLVHRHDILIPLAAYVGMPICNKIPAEDVRSLNYEAVSAINNLRSNWQKLLYPTTNSGYGETDGESFCDEESPLCPISLYGETKALAEQELLKG